MTPQERHARTAKFFHAGITRQDIAEYVEACGRSVLTDAFAAEYNAIRAALAESRERERVLGALREAWAIRAEWIASSGRRGPDGMFQVDAALFTLFGPHPVSLTDAPEPQTNLEP